MIEGKLIRIFWYNLYQQDASSFFLVVHFLRTSQLNCLTLNNFGIGNLLGSFSKSMRVRTKHWKDSC